MMVVINFYLPPNTNSVVDIFKSRDREVVA